MSSFEIRGRDGAAHLYHGDALDVMPRLMSVDHVFADPPYEEEAHAPGRRVLAAGLKVIEQPLDFPATTPELRAASAREMARLSSGWVLVFCQVEACGLWRADLEAGGAAWRRGMTWVKTDATPQLSGDRPAQGSETIACAWAGGGRSFWNGGGRSSVLTTGKSDPGMGHGGPRNPHPTMKPQKLMRQLIELFTQPGDVILDPFMGSGSTGVAALSLGRRFVGIEHRRDYFDLAVKRVGMAQQQLELAI